MTGTRTFPLPVFGSFTFDYCKKDPTHRQTHACTHTPTPTPTPTPTHTHTHTHTHTYTQKHTHTRIVCMSAHCGRYKEAAATRAGIDGGDQGCEQSRVERVFVMREALHHYFTTHSRSISLNEVVFPAALSPHMPTNEPASTLNEILFSSFFWVPGYLKTTFTNSISPPILYSGSSSSRCLNACCCCCFRFELVAPLAGVPALPCASRSVLIAEVGLRMR